MFPLDVYASLQPRSCFKALFLCLYASSVLAVMHPSQKIWAKRPLATFMQRYCKLLWDPVQLLADKMLSELGNLGQQAVLRLSKASSQRYLDLADREPVDNSGR